MGNETHKCYASYIKVKIDEEGYLLLECKNNPIPVHIDFCPICGYKCPKEFLKKMAIYPVKNDKEKITIAESDGLKFHLDEKNTSRIQEQYDDFYNSNIDKLLEPQENVKKMEKDLHEFFKKFYIHKNLSDEEIIKFIKGNHENLTALFDHFETGERYFKILEELQEEEKIKELLEKSQDFLTILQTNELSKRTRLTLLTCCLHNLEECIKYEEK